MTETLFRPVQKRRAAEGVAEQIRSQILDGSFEPGRRLPPERELASSFGVNRTTVREALRSLEQQRLLDIHHGDGATVLDVQVYGGLDLLAYLVKVDGRLDLSLMVEILEARRGFGVELARLAALRSTDQDLERLQDRVDQLARLAGSGEQSVEQFQALDWSFFEALAAAAKNRVLSLILNTIRPIYDEHRELFLPIYRERETIVRLHRELLDRLRDKDPTGAAEAMTRFLDLAPQSYEDAPVTAQPAAALAPEPAQPVTTAPAASWTPEPARPGAALAQVFRSPEPAQPGTAPSTPALSNPKPAQLRPAPFRPTAPSAEPWLERSPS